MTTLSLPPVGAARRRGPSAWSLGAALIALIVVGPIMAVVWIALAPGGAVPRHAKSTQKAL